jgi:hypothetical protein
MDYGFKGQSSKESIYHVLPCTNVVTNLVRQNLSVTLTFEV